MPVKTPPKAPPKSNGSEPKAPLPATLVKSLPTASEVVKHVAAIEALIPKLEKELQAAGKRGALDLARAFVVLHRIHEVTLSDKVGRLKALATLFETYKSHVVPEAFEQAGVPHVALDEGYRVGISTPWRASLKADDTGVTRLKAYDWLRKNHPDVISETVNSSTLSALAKELHEDKNKTLPDDLFNAAQVPAASVTRT